jgi:hypothetical protein
VKPDRLCGPGPIVLLTVCDLQCYAHAFGEAGEAGAAATILEQENPDRLCGMGVNPGLLWG